MDIANRRFTNLSTYVDNYCKVLLYNLSTYVDNYCKVLLYNLSTYVDNTIVSCLFSHINVAIPRRVEVFRIYEIFFCSANTLQFKTLEVYTPLGVWRLLSPHTPHVQFSQVRPHIRFLSNFSYMPGHVTFFSFSLTGNNNHNLCHTTLITDSVFVSYLFFF